MLVSYFNTTYMSLFLNYTNITFCCETLWPTVRLSATFLGTGRSKTPPGSPVTWGGRWAGLVQRRQDSNRRWGSEKCPREGWLATSVQPYPPATYQVPAPRSRNLHHHTGVRTTHNQGCCCPLNMSVSVAQRLELYTKLPRTNVKYPLKIS